MDTRTLAANRPATANAALGQPKQTPTQILPLTEDSLISAMSLRTRLRRISAEMGGAGSQSDAIEEKPQTLVAMIHDTNVILNDCQSEVFLIAKLLGLNLD